MIAVAQSRLHAAVPFSVLADERDRIIRRRIGIAWGLLVLNVVTFYAGLPLIVPIPSFVGKIITQGALPAALLVALSANRRIVVRPNLFLCLASVLVFEAVVTAMQPQFLGTVYRTFRFAEFVAALWLLTPWWGRRDLMLVRYHLTALTVVLSSVLLGLVADPGLALPGGRLSGVVWPIPAPQVAHYAAVVSGLMVVLWLGGKVRAPLVLCVVAVAGLMLVLTHTRTALAGLVAGTLVAGLSLLRARSRARKFFTGAGLAVLVLAITFAGPVTAWLVRGEGARGLEQLTGRTTTWTLITSFPRDTFHQFFGFGLSNSSFDGLPIDSNWLASYQEQGLIGVAMCAAILVFLFAAAYFQAQGLHRALALFLVTYCLIASITETGFTDASSYLLELALAASLVVPAAATRVSPG